MTLYHVAPPPHPLRLVSILVSLLYYLVSAYPSQSLFYERLHSLPTSFLLKQSPPYIWISTLTSGLRSRNYFKLEELTRRSAFTSLIHESPMNAVHHPSLLAEQALCAIIGKLRALLRETAWSVIRSAYRELSCCPDRETTKDWLSRSLVLHSTATAAGDMSLEDWLQQKIKDGHIKTKGNIDGIYIICKVR
jgi:hypothetical protein